VDIDSRWKIADGRWKRERLKAEPDGVISTPQAEDGWKMADGRWENAEKLNRRSPRRP
jgi:hypothetical protein